MIELNANYLGQLVRGTIRWPHDPLRRDGFRAVLGVKTDTDLGFRQPRRGRYTVADVDRQEFIRAALSVGAATDRFGEPHKRLAEVAELTHRIGSAVVV